MDASSYKAKVINQDAMHFCLNVVEFLDALPEDREIFKRASLDALTFCTTLQEVGLYLLNFKELAINHPHVDKDKFLSLACIIGKNTPELFAFLQTSKLLASKKDFQAWQDFFSAAIVTAETQATAKITITAEFFTTIRHLSNNMQFTQWTDFFSASLVALENNITVADFFTTVRHLADNNGFNQWTDFFKMVKRLKDRASSNEAEVFTAVRHAIQYLNTNESAKGLFRVLAEAPQYSEAFAYGQLDSKKWLLEEAQKVWGNNWGTVFVLAGWIGVLPRMIYDQNIRTTKIRSFDLDGPANQASEYLNQDEVQKDWLFKSSKQDIAKMQYPTTYNVLRKDGSECELTDVPDVVINTSCEHIQDIASWWSQIPHGTRVILQTNDGFQIPEHVACFKSLKDFAQMMSLSRTEYAGKKALPEFNRYMLIGTK
jgi:hypothetical protein